MNAQVKPPATAPDLVNIEVDGQPMQVAKGSMIIHATDAARVAVPRFCYHEKLSIAANCRMCLVDVEKSPKPVPACATPVMEGMKIFTRSERAQTSQRNVMEFLLINHPLDCPICDQGGECELQDVAMGYGRSISRFVEQKRVVADEDIGPLIATEMTRCIQCTRCVRFMSEIAGSPELGGIGRGEHLEIGTYVEQMVGSELSGNLIDVCPVGALTSKPYAFTARPWELRKVDSLDVFDAVGSNIRIDTRGGAVMRIQPRLNEDVNEEWISDKVRFSWDGLKQSRLDTPYVRVDGKLKPASWGEAFGAIADRIAGLSGEKMAALAGDTADCEAIVALKDLMTALGCTAFECRTDGAQFDTSTPAGWLFNTTIAGLEQADAILLVGTNPRTEAALINARIRKTWLSKRIKIGLIGAQCDLNYPVKYLGAGAETLEELAAGKGAFADVLKGAKNPVIILGMGALRRADGMAIHALARKVAATYNMVREDWNGFNLLHTAASRTGALMLGFTGGNLDKMLSAQMLYLLDADNIPVEKIGKDTFVIYQGHHGDKAAARADVILPGAAYTEKNATYVNTEGRVQTARQAVFPPGEAREDWKIIRALSEMLAKTLPYDDIAQVRARLAAVNPAFTALNQPLKAEWKSFGTEGKADKAPFAVAVENFYQTDSVTRASKTMAACTAAFVANATTAKTGT